MERLLFQDRLAPAELLSSDGHAMCGRIMQILLIFVKLNCLAGMKGCVSNVACMVVVCMGTESELLKEMSKTKSLIWRKRGHFGITKKKFFRGV